MRRRECPASDIVGENGGLVVQSTFSELDFLVTLSARLHTLSQKRSHLHSAHFEVSARCWAALFNMIQFGLTAKDRGRLEQIEAFLSEMKNTGFVMIDPYNRVVMHHSFSNCAVWLANKPAMPPS